MLTLHKTAMDWKDYRKRYSNFLASLQQTELIFYHAAKAIPDTPIRVEEDAKIETPFLVNFFRKSFRGVSGGWRTDHMLLDIEPVVHLVFNSKKERILSYHELTMIVAHLETFVSDTFRVIWKLNPLVLECTSTGIEMLKQFGASKISTLNSEQIESIQDRAVWDLMRKSTDAYMNYLTTALSLSIQTDYKLLYRANLDRNAIVHNGGIITQDKYIAKLNERDRQGLVIGEPIPISADYVNRVFNLVQTLGETIFEEVSQKYFEVSEPLLANEKVTNRESPAKERNPLEDIASEAIANVGGPDKAVTNPHETTAEMYRLITNRYRKGFKQ